MRLKTSQRLPPRKSVVDWHINYSALYDEFELF